jgi:hypothetical protein
VERRELQELKDRICLLEEELNNRRYEGGGELVMRLGNLEEQVDRTRAENDVELRGMHRRFKGVWENILGANKRITACDDAIEAVIDDVHQMRTRLIDVDDATMRIEDRVDVLEHVRPNTPISRRRKASTPPSVAVDGLNSPARSDMACSTTSIETRVPVRFLSSEDSSNVQRFRERVASVGSGSQSWTVHISLLPSPDQPFPFEKDTAAYKRCLSRGLHQVIVIPDTDSDSFTTAVNVAFADILRGRTWEPLNAQICNAPTLRGLPMLRRMEKWLVGSDYDVDFLSKNCAVCDESGKILDLYIAMSEDTISWADLKELAPCKEGLEESWMYDTLLDGPDSEGAKAFDGTLDRRPAAGDILPSWSPSLKRNAADISRTPSFGSTPDGEASRTKFRRQCTGAAVEIVGRRAEAV